MRTCFKTLSESDTFTYWLNIQAHLKKLEYHGKSFAVFIYLFQKVILSVLILKFIPYYSFSSKLRVFLFFFSIIKIKILKCMKSLNVLLRVLYMYFF